MSYYNRVEQAARVQFLANIDLEDRQDEWHPTRASLIIRASQRLGDGYELAYLPAGSEIYRATAYAYRASAPTITGSQATKWVVLLEGQSLADPNGHMHAGFATLEQAARAWYRRIALTPKVAA